VRAGQEHGWVGRWRGVRGGVPQGWSLLGLAGEAEDEAGVDTGGGSSHGRTWQGLSQQGRIQYPTARWYHESHPPHQGFGSVDVSDGVYDCGALPARPTAFVVIICVASFTRFIGLKKSVGPTGVRYRPLRPGMCHRLLVNHALSNSTC
jgi:hypothetical protein